jgi:hypothetical protein
MFKRKIHVNLLVLIGIIVPTVTITYNEVFHNDIQKGILSSFEIEIPQTKIKPVQESGLREVWKFIKGRDSYKEPNITLLDRLKLAFQYQTPYYLPDQKPIVDLKTIDKLEIIKGGSNVSESLIKQITSFKDVTQTKNFLMTTAGLKTIAEFISMPTTNISLIRQRQSIIKALIKEADVLQEISSLLKKMQSAESSLYEFLHGYEDEPTSPLLQQWGLDKSVIALTLGDLGKVTFLPFFSMAGPAVNVLRDKSAKNDRFLHYYRQQLKGRVADDQVEKMAQEHFKKFQKTPQYKKALEEDNVKLAIVSALFFSNASFST